MTAYDQGPLWPELQATDDAHEAHDADEAEVADIAAEGIEASPRAEAPAIETALLDTSPPPVHVWQAIERTLRREGRIG